MHSAQAMYDLVNDVSCYPSFMDGCQGVEIFEQSTSTMLARLDLKKAGVGLSLMTRNHLKAPSQINMTLEDGPLSTFAEIGHSRGCLMQPVKSNLIWSLILVVKH